MKWYRLHNKILVVLISILILISVQPAYTQSDSSHEYEIKAVFLCQFFNFVDGWEFQEQVNDINDNNDNKLLLIGIIGINPFGDAFEPLMEKITQNRKLTVKYFKGLSELQSENGKIEIQSNIENIKKCHLLFISNSEKPYLDEILSPIRNEKILTVADTSGFLERGGVINLIIKKNKVQFNINTAAAKRAKLSIRAKLLRLAQKVIEEDQIGE